MESETDPDRELASLKRENPVLNLAPDQQRTLVELVQAHDEGRIDRRNMLKAAGLAGVGMTVGGSGYLAATENAQASHGSPVGSVGTPSNPNDVFAHSVDAGTVSITDRQVIRYTADGYTVPYPLSDYSDLGAALQDAHDDALAAGEQQFTVEISAGTHTVTTPAVVELNPYIVGRGIGNAWRNNETGTVIVNDTGDYWLTLRGSSNSIDSNRLNAGFIKGLEMRPAADGASVGAVYMDGTDGTNPSGSIVRGVTFEDCSVKNHGSVPLAYEGTVFDITFHRLVSRSNDEPAVTEVSTGASRTAGPASQFFFVSCYLWSDSGAYAVAPGANGAAFLGGSVAGANDGNGINMSRCSGGGIFGTHLEGVSTTGTIGILHTVNGPNYYMPSLVTNWDTGISIGDGTSAQARDARILTFGGSNVSEDILVTSGGTRNRTIIDQSAVHSITNERSSVDGIDDLYEWNISTV